MEAFELIMRCMNVKKLLSLFVALMALGAVGVSAFETTYSVRGVNMDLSMNSNGAIGHGSATLADGTKYLFVQKQGVWTARRQVGIVRTDVGVVSVNFDGVNTLTVPELGIIAYVNRLR